MGEAVDEDTLPGDGTEAVGVGLVGRRQLGADRLAGRQLLGLIDVDQAEAVGPGGVAHTVHGEHVFPGRQVVHHVAGTLPRIGLRERAVVVDRAARAFERPADVPVVGQRIEDHAQVFAEREGVAVNLAGDVQAAIDARRDRVTGKQYAGFEGFEDQLVAGRCRRAQAGQRAFQQPLEQPRCGRHPRTTRRSCGRLLLVVVGPRVHPGFPAWAKLVVIAGPCDPLCHRGRARTRAAPPRVHGVGAPCSVRWGSRSGPWRAADVSRRRLA